MQNWTNGMAEQVVTCNAHNGLDAWRKPCHDQLPAINHRKEMLMNESNELGKAIALVELKKRIADLERITSKWPELSQSVFG